MKAQSIQALDQRNRAVCALTDNDLIVVFH